MYFSFLFIVRFSELNNMSWNKLNIRNLLLNRITKRTRVRRKKSFIVVQVLAT